MLGEEIPVSTKILVGNAPLCVLNNSSLGELQLAIFGEVKVRIFVSFNANQAFISPSRCIHNTEFMTPVVASLLWTENMVWEEQETAEKEEAHACLASV